MTWHFPLDTWEGDNKFAIPRLPHVGSFGMIRKHHTHEGVDLYTAPKTIVRAVESSIVVAILPFTGPAAGSPWWQNTMCLMAEGPSGVVNYGEISLAKFKVGDKINASDPIGYVETVLAKDKGLPTSMLHIELYEHGIREPVEWLPNTPQPIGLLDPTPFLEDTHRAGKQNWPSIFYR